MRRFNLVALMLVSLSVPIMFIAGCSKMTAPNRDEQLKIAVDSLTVKALDTDKIKGIINTPYGTFGVKKISVLNSLFLAEPLIGECVKRRDVNGVERDMWVIEISALVNVEYAVDFYGTDKKFKRSERYAYKTFTYKSKEGKYLFENGVVESYGEGGFEKS
ncbi:MAG: hypothetical protein HGA36_01130 [Candidatus Moranbacteria bacterium]|nr:hypothetical protein [Candidatus Moranbacteria bacterium]